MAVATFIDSAMVDDELTSLTTARLPIAVSARMMGRACRRVVALIKGYNYEVAAPADAPAEWGDLAVEWLAASMYSRFPEYFKAKMPTIQEVEARIASTARVEPAENVTYARSSGGPGDDWDPPGDPCGCGGSWSP